MKRYIQLVSILAFLSLASCRKFVEIPTPENQISSSSAFADDNTAIATINGVYSKMIGSSLTLCSSVVTLYPGMSADELTYYGISTRDNFIQNTLGQNNNTELEAYMWIPGYNLIYASNSCIEGASKSNSISAPIKNKVIGEALFVRSFIYFNLINLFGDVPLITTTDYETNSKIGRAPVNDVYQQILNDLSKAETLLTDEYPSAGRVRPNKATVQALLAKVYLYRLDWNNALLKSNSIIANTKYSLPTDLNSVFLSSSQEAIWQLAPVTPNYNTYVGNIIIPASASIAPTYYITNSLMNDFEVNDKRKSSWLQSRIYKSQTLYYPYKYKIKTGATVTENYMVFRLAEIYLIRAEARAQLGDLPGAIADLNAIRVRAGLGLVSPSIGTIDLLATIQHERRIELFSEWGNRWFDLKRTNTANQILGNLKATWKPTAVLYPIPYSQIIINPALKQNEGY